MMGPPRELSSNSAALLKFLASFSSLFLGMTPTFPVQLSLFAFINQSSYYEWTIQVECCFSKFYFFAFED